MKKILAVIGITVIMSLVGAIAGCAAGPGEGEEGQGEVQLELVEWGIQHTRGPATYNSVAYKEFAQIISDRTNGGFKITIYDSKGLNIPWEEGLESVSSGAVPIFGTPTSYMAGSNSFFLAESLAGMITSVEAHSLYTSSLFDLRAKVLDQYNVTELAHWPFDKQVWASSKPLPTLEDIKGTRIRVSSADLSYVIDGIGGLPISMAFNEIYVAMQRGAMDGFVTGVGAMHGISAWEVADYLTDMTMSQAGEILMVNDEAYAALPDSYRQVLQEETFAFQQRMYYLTKTKELEEQAFLISQGMTYVAPSQELRDAITEVGTAYWSKWAQDGGPDAKAAFQIAQQLGYAK